MSSTFSIGLWLALAAVLGPAAFLALKRILTASRLRRVGAVRCHTVGVQTTNPELLKPALHAAAKRLSEIPDRPRPARYSGFVLREHYYFSSTSRYPASDATILRQWDILREELTQRGIRHRRVRSIWRRRRYGVLFGLEESFGSGVLHSMTEVQEALAGERGVTCLEATLYSTYEGKAPYSEPAVLVLVNSKAVLDTLAQLAAELGQEFLPVIEGDRWTYTLDTNR
jgi:hypothetical protein